MLRAFQQAVPGDLDQITGSLSNAGRNNKNKNKNKNKNNNNNNNNSSSSSKSSSNNNTKNKPLEQSPQSGAGHADLAPHQFNDPVAVSGGKRITATPAWQ
ncbi:unnamed protein product [Polarella glacialis]|uniref:Uncharacterized protein n=1 Tax=Polarella glacialis TaxID=89957 RepID=A0A813FBP6_POLGL|nr:unnamed protein product [Polarella glacialis]CAE8705673.1 unnamed protein product [Polarella glacialis]